MMLSTQTLWGSLITLQDIYKLGQEAGELKATLAHTFEAGRRAVMNCAVHPGKGNILAVGMDNRCQVLDLGIKDVIQNSAEGNKSKGKIIRQSKRTFNVTESKSQVTVSGGDGKGDDDDDDVGFQKVVRFTADGNFIVTGGSDGHVRVLKVRVTFSTVYRFFFHPCVQAMD